MPHLFRALLGALLLLALCTPEATVQAQRVSVSAEINFGFFYDRLSPHGTWVEVADHGWSWHPHEVAVDWRPYTHGCWSYTNDCGWYFTSDDEWGWAGHHYGRWVTVETRWHWVPGYEWSGGWVAWRHGGGHMGWAPLPPRAHWEVGVGIRTAGFSYENDIHVNSWSFVAEADFDSPRLHTVVVKRANVAVIVGKAPIAGSVTISGGVVVNRAVTLEVATKATGRQIKARTLRDSDTLGGSVVAGDEGELRVFRPKVVKGDAKPPRADDKDRVAGAARQTMREKHDTEARELPERQQRSGKDENSRKAEREDLDRRHKQEESDVERKHGKARDNLEDRDRNRPDSKNPDRPDREPSKEPRKDPADEPRREPRKEPADEPRKEPRKDPTDEPRKEPRKDPADEPRREPVKEPADEPRREPVKEPSREPGKSSGKEPGKEPGKQGSKGGGKEK